MTDTQIKLVVTSILLAILVGWLSWVHYDITHYDRVEMPRILCRVQSDGREVCMETGETYEARIRKP